MFRVMGSAHGDTMACCSGSNVFHAKRISGVRAGGGSLPGLGVVATDERTMHALAAPHALRMHER